MEPRSPSPLSRLLLLLAVWSLNMSLVAGDFQGAYCSTQNTGTTSDFNWTWQSNGKCTDWCKSQGSFAFAVIKYKDCWCSNYIPAQQVDTSGCMQNCPGFPDEKCGDADKGLYIYIKMDGTPSGTQDNSQPTPSSPAPAAPSQPANVVTPNPETVFRTVTAVPPASTAPSSISFSSAMPSAKPSTVTPKSSALVSQSMLSMTSVWVVTESGAIVTRTLLVSPTPGASQNGNRKGSSSIGAIVGGVVGGVFALLAIVAGILFLLRRRKQQQEEDGLESNTTGITRNTSTMSKAGLIGNSAEKDSHYPQYPSHVATSFGSQGSRHDIDSITPGSTDRRSGVPLVIDSRLDPRAVLTFHGSNVSRDSLASIDDSRDYGRQLNIRNPDLEGRS